MFYLAFRSLFAHPARNAFTAFSVTVAMFLFAFVIGAQLQTRTRLEMLKGRNNMLVTTNALPMPMSFRQQIESVPGVKRTIYMLVLDSMSPDKKLQFLLHGTTADYTTISPAWFYVDPDDLAAWEKERTGALVGRFTARDMGLKVGSRVTLQTSKGPVPIVVSAISPRGYKSTGVIVHYDYLAELFNLKNRVSVFWVELQPDADLKTVSRAVDEMTKNTDTPTISVSSAGALRTWAQAGRVIPNLLTGASLIILFATLLVTANTIAIGIRERIPELATLRAIGFRRGKIVRLLVTEVLMVCLFGGVLGAIIPVLVFQNGVDMASGMLVLQKVELPPEVVGWAMLLSAALALVASAYPAWRASRADIPAALRSQ